MNNGIPFVEAHRPKKFEDIVLDPLNKQILSNIIETSYFPNLFFYGPPGTGKTTTIINLINAYQEKLNAKNKYLIIHLNASDERGIDIIRNQINLFVNSQPMFHTGMKFVILDEVDYMTKNAQQALKYLLQNFTNNVRFCLICNYISKIDESLQNEFIKLRFNQLPVDNIIDFLKNIVKKENLNINDKSLSFIQKLYKSDMRSMINLIQSNINIMTISTDNLEKNELTDNNEINPINPINPINEIMNLNIIGDDIWLLFIEKLQQKETTNNINLFIHSVCIDYNIDKKNIIKDFINYIIRNHPNYITSEFLHFVENLMHTKIDNNNIHVNYSITKLRHFLSKNE